MPYITINSLSKFISERKPIPHTHFSRVSSFKFVSGRIVNQYSTSDMSDTQRIWYFSLCVSGERPDMTYRLLCRRFTRCTLVMCSSNNKVLADCQYSTRRCLSMGAMSMSGIKVNSEDNLCCAACVTITRWEWGWRKWCERTSCCGGQRMLTRRQVLLLCFQLFHYLFEFAKFSWIRMSVNRETGAQL